MTVRKPILLLFFLAPMFVFGQEQTLILKTEIRKPIVNNQEDLLIKLSLRNQLDKPILIHKYIGFGYLSMCFDNDFCFEVEKKANKAYKKMEETANIDIIPGFDSTGLAWDDMYDTLTIGRIFFREFNINGYYSFDKGQYRARFSFQPPIKNNLPFKKIYSSWVYFEVNAKHIDFHL